VGADEAELAPLPADAGQAQGADVAVAAELDVHGAAPLRARADDGSAPVGRDALEASLDVFDSELVVERSTGERRTVSLVPARTVADVYADLRDALAALGVNRASSTTPQELADTTPLHEDRKPASYDPAPVLRWFTAATATAGVFDRWRAHFFGRTGIQVWWGALDVSLMLFNGRHVEAPRDRGYLLRYDLDAEPMNVGLYYGDEKTKPFFYGYAFPEPVDAESLSMAPAAATRSTTLNEWTLPYEAVREASDPERELTSFLDAVYAACYTAGGWDRTSLTYAQPVRR